MKLRVVCGNIDGIVEVPDEMNRKQAHALAAMKAIAKCPDGTKLGLKIQTSAHYIEGLKDSYGDDVFSDTVEILKVLGKGYTAL